MKKIALMTSGGDSPGMNACIRAIVKTAIHHKVIPFGIYDGFQGMIEGRGFEMSYTDMDNIIYTGGTILGTARSEEFKTEAGRKKAVNYLKQENIDGLVVIGGDGSFMGAHVLGEDMDIPIIGLPGTIDNDIFGTDHTIGYDTALNTVMEAIDKIRDTASSHHRVFFIEVMGRNAGFIALNSAIASGAESVLIPEEVTDINVLVEQIKTQNKGRRSTIVVVAEGDDQGGAKDITEKVTPHLPGYNVRYSILGHLQRGGRPSATDRIIATRMGAHSVELLLEGKSNLMVGIYGDKLATCPIYDSINKHAVPELSKLDLLKKLRTQ